MKTTGFRWMISGLAGLAFLLTAGCESDSGSSSADVVWLDADVSGWPATAKLNASISGDTVHLAYDKARVWPTASTRAKDGGALNANCWVIANREGKWYGGTFEWLKVGGTTRPLATVRGSGHITRAPLNTFVPVSGEKVGFMVSTPARSNDRTINERSNISWVIWP